MHLENLPFERLALSERSSTIALLLRADWMMLKSVSNQGGANRLTVAPQHTKICLVLKLSKMSFTPLTPSYNV